MTRAVDCMSIESVEEQVDEIRYQKVRVLTTVILELVCITPLN